MAKSKRISVLLTEESEHLLRELAARQSAPTPLAALCQVALEFGLQKMCSEKPVGVLGIRRTK